ncbi:MAG: hypothetical protein PF574_02285, partial [Candidatus Delongbacteria bacterium]|nr:hypothetical protein [Candidatus Delongbacteria bacterium]
TGNRQDNLKCSTKLNSPSKNGDIVGETSHGLPLLYSDINNPKREGVGAFPYESDFTDKLK